MQLGKKRVVVATLTLLNSNYAYLCLSHNHRNNTWIFRAHQVQH